MKQLVILDEAPRLHDNPLLNALQPEDLVLLRLPTQQTRQALIKRQLLEHFASVLRQLGYQVLEQTASNAEQILRIVHAYHCQHVLIAEPAACYEQRLLEQLQTSTIAISTVDVNGLLCDELRPLLTQLPTSYSQFRRAREPELLTSPVQPSRYQASPCTASPRHRVYALGPAAMFDHLLDEHWWLTHLEHYIRGPLLHYKQSRNQLIGEHFASFFSTALALGILSVRHVYQQILRFEALTGEHQSAQWLRFELWWREYFRWVSRKEGRKLFTGLAHHSSPAQVPSPQQQAHLLAWQAGRTGVPIVDANMRLLAQTGLLSNRGRQLVASYLVFDLGVDWRHGARWFEQQLLDYDCANNYGNWAYISGALYSPARWFNQLKQASEYDPDGDFVALILGASVQNKPAGMARHQPYVADLGLPFDRRWYEYLHDADVGLV